jgi:type II secretory ATPase GspE/PulE/Tfp pilus assembly ATPase PilB-like protein
LTDAEAIALGRPSLAGRTVHTARGCLYCAGRGFAGRVGLFECMAPDPEVSSLIAGGRSEADLLALLRGKGFRSLMDDGVAKAMEGVSTVAEVLEVATEG